MSMSILAVESLAYALTINDVEYLRNSNNPYTPV